MTADQLQCPFCSADLKVDLAMSAPEVKCPTCNTMVAISQLVSQGEKRPTPKSRKPKTTSKSANPASKSARPASTAPSVASLLPLSTTGEVGVAPGLEVPLPATKSSVAQSPPPVTNADVKAKPNSPQVLFNVDSGGQGRSVSRRSSKEMASRRFRKNLVVWTACAVVLVLCVVLLIVYGKSL